MSNSGASQLGLYSPLPQSISDSDSEEELHSTLPKNFDPKVSNGASKDYHQLDESEEQINGFPNLNSSHMDDVPIIKEGYRQPMSPIRKFCFISSIIVCFLTIVIFLWVLPCSDDKTCPAVHPKHYSSSWDKDYEGIELMGPINVVNSSNGKSKNLVVLFRNDIVHLGKNNGGGGVISIMGDSGNVAWYIPRQRTPKRLECNLLDVNNNGVKDCVVTGENGLFEALDPQSGKVHWNIHIPNNKSLFSSVEFPLVVLDVNNDRVNDLITSCSLDNGKHNVIIFISGRMGAVLGKPFIASDCERIDTLILDKKYLTYICQKMSVRTKIFFPYKDLYFQLLNKTYSDHFVPNFNNNNPFSIQNKKANPKIFYENGKKLTITNDGSCPKCKVSVQLFENKAQKNNLTWSFLGKNMYGMLPTKINFKNTQNNFNLQGHINGYVLKFWQWTNQKYSPNYIKTKRRAPPLTQKDPFNLNVPKKKLWRLPRSIPISTEKSKNLTEVSLEERVMLLTYNATNFKTINASQAPIKQLCYTEINKVCQPDLALQEKSVLLVDLDNDGSQELISYLASYQSVDGGDDTQKYVLKTTVKVIQLEKELPKLYESILNVSLGMNKAIFK